MRHAEKAEESTEPDVELSIDGRKRATLLGHLLARSGITSVHSTDTVRTRATVQPAADRYRIPVETYAAPGDLAASVLAAHRGDVVLVAAHSNTVAEVLNGFGASVPAADVQDYDNLFLLTVEGSRVSVTNLQYGVDSQVDNVKNQAGAKTLLLVGLEGSNDDAARLAHAAHKSGVGAIYSSRTRPPLLQKLAGVLGIRPTLYQKPAMLAKTLLFSTQTGVVMIAGTHDELRAIVKALGSAPFPTLYAGDRDHLLAITILPSRASRLVPLRF